MSESDAEFVERVFSVKEQPDTHYFLALNAAARDRLRALARKGAEADALRSEVEKLKGLLKRHNDLSGKPECALGYEEKCPGPCTCGWDEWFIETHALARETRAALGDTHE